MDHGALVPLFYLTKNITPKLVHLSFSQLSFLNHYRYSELVGKVSADNSKMIAVIVSGDLSHRLIPGAPEVMKDINNHDPKKHGLIVKCADGRCGLLLPDLEGIDTIDKQFDISCQKGGIDPEKDGPSLYFFTVEKHA